MSSGSIKHYLGRGLAADRPASLDLASNTVGFWLSTDTGEWSAWNGSTWLEDIMAAGDGGAAPLYTAAVSGTTITLDLGGGTKKNWVIPPLTANSTLVISDPSDSSHVTEFEARVSQNSTGGYTLTLPSSMRPLGDSDTAVAAGANKVTIISAKSFDGGTNYDFAMQERG